MESSDFRFSLIRDPDADTDGWGILFAHPSPYSLLLGTYFQEGVKTSTLLAVMLSLTLERKHYFVWWPHAVFSFSFCCKIRIVVQLRRCVSLFCDPMNLSLPHSSVTGISQPRILAWVAISFSRGSFPTQGLHLSLLLGRWILYHWATWEAHKIRGDSPNWDTVCVLKWKMLTFARGPFL